MMQAVRTRAGCYFHTGCIQVDAILSQRGRHSEHEAQREIKNEFMAMWDGIRAMGGAADERILVGLLMQAALLQALASAMGVD